MTDQPPTEQLEPSPVWAPSPQPAVPQGGASGAVVGAGVILLVIATLLGIFAIFAVFAGLIMGQMPSFSGDTGLTPEETEAFMTFGRTFVIAFGGVALAFAVAHLLSGIGVLRRRGWARILGLVLSVLGVLLWLLILASAVIAATQPIPSGYLENSGLTLEEYRAVARTGTIFGIVFTAIGLSAYTFVLVVLARRGSEFA
jgi:hypothetical protein